MISAIPTSLKRKRRIVVHDLVTRYGPQSVASAQVVEKRLVILRRKAGEAASPAVKKNSEDKGSIYRRYRWMVAVALKGGSFFDATMKKNQ